MSAAKKIAGLVAGVTAVAVIGVAVAQGVPPDPRISNPALGAGEQTVQGTLIGETGQLAEYPMVTQQTALLSKEAEPAAVASETQPAEPVAQAPSSDTTVAQATPAPAPADNTMGAAPEPQQQPATPQKPKHEHSRNPRATRKPARLTAVAGFLLRDALQDQLPRRLQIGSERALRIGHLVQLRERFGVMS